MKLKLLQLFKIILNKKIYNFTYNYLIHNNNLFNIHNSNLRKNSKIIIG